MVLVAKCNITLQLHDLAILRKNHISFNPTRDQKKIQHVHLCFNFFFQIRQTKLIPYGLLLG